MTPGQPEAIRRTQLAANLAAVRQRIAAAALAAGREADSVTLVAVTKTCPASDVVLLADLGVGDIGENRDQEAATKAAEAAAAGAHVRWHFVGQLQRNKARSVVGYADMVHSVDSVGLARALDSAAQRHRDRPLDVLVQVGLDDDPRRGGVMLGREAQAAAPDRAYPRVVDEITGAARLRLRGVMAVAPLPGPGGADRSPQQWFAALARIAADLRASHRQADVVSAGMTDDFETAIAYGATHVRLGSALLGKRERLE